MADNQEDLKPAGQTPAAGPEQPAHNKVEAKADAPEAAREMTRQDASPAPEAGTPSRDVGEETRGEASPGIRETAAEEADEPAEISESETVAYAGDEPENSAADSNGRGAAEEAESSSDDLLEDAAMEEEFREAVADAQPYVEDETREGQAGAPQAPGANEPPSGEPKPQGTNPPGSQAPGRERRQHPQRNRPGRRQGHGQGGHGQGSHGGHAQPGQGRNQGGGQQHGQSHGQGRGHGQHGHEHARREIVTGRHQPHGHGKKAVKVEILANTSFEETRIAVLENNRLVEMLWERKSAENIVGNIYKGVIENVLPGISSAFIDIGFEKNAYLYISDVLGDTRVPIDHTLKKGQQVMIQVAKEAIGTKGMKVTMNVSLPGRYLVFTPFDKEVGLSKHITDAAERSRLSSLVGKLTAEHMGGRGVVVRTEAEGATDAELTREVKYLWRTWEAIQRRFDSTQAPCLLHKDLDLTMQVARDMLSEEVYVYLMDNKDAYQNVLDFVGKISPDLKEGIRYYDGKTPIFSAFNIESEIEKLRQIKVSLPSGGTIVVQEAESLCAIDVNTGRFTGSKSQEETVTMTNIEAAQEIAHQLRLRNIGGIVVIDFIDMKKASNRNRVMEALAEAVKRDRAKIRILPITRLGLIEMTRERKRESTVSLMTDECPECHGAGRVLSAESLRIRIQREIKELTQGRPGGQIRLQLHPQLFERFKEMQTIIEKNVHRAIKIQPDPMLPWEDYKIILE